jgi:hypothetical protein
VTVPNPLGAFYVYPDVTGLLGREWAGRNVTSSLELADLILDAAEVAVVPGEAFGPSGYLRLSYALVTTSCSKSPAPAAPVRLIAARGAAGARGRATDAQNRNSRAAATAASDSAAILRFRWMPRSARSG